MSKTKESHIAYIIPSLPFGITLRVKKSANAWWMNQTKVYQLFTAFSFDATILEACSFVDISLRQYKYFVKLHPEVSEIRHGYSLTPMIKAKQTVINAIAAGDVKTAWKYLEKVDPEFRKQPKKKNRGLIEWEKNKFGHIVTDPNLNEALKAYNEAYNKAVKESKN